ncbi:MAG: CRTAC1 family protein [Bryobacteraceae bacterium]
MIFAIALAVSSFFEDVSARSGVTMVLRNSATPEKHQIETMPGGVAMFDFDRRQAGSLLCQWRSAAGVSQDGEGVQQPLIPQSRLFQIRRCNQAGRTCRRRLQHGAAAADFDNDGFCDIFVTGVQGNHLYRNQGNGTFAAIKFPESKSWSIAAGWFDYDRDGYLDLFVVNYVRWNPATEPFCGDVNLTYRTYCHPKYYEGLPNVLYRNLRNGAFTDVSAATGIARYTGKGMGVAFADYDNDGDTDVFVANDTVPNFLFRNDASTFVEVGMQAGIGLNDDGRALSSMGVDFRDIDNDGKADLFVTALANETFPLYRNAGNGVFIDATYPSKIGAATMALSGWGAGAYDFDNDGWKDLFAANGDVNDNSEIFSSRSSRQRSLLLRNPGTGTFEAHSLGVSALHRGAAFGDLDNDGAVDIVLSRLNETPVLLRNLAEKRWLGLRLTGKRSNRDGIGAQVRIGKQWNHATTSVGYASSSDKRVHFGLGDVELVDIEIDWPSGTKQRLQQVMAGQYLEVREP